MIPEQQWNNILNFDVFCLCRVVENLTLFEIVVLCSLVFTFLQINFYVGPVKYILSLIQYTESYTIKTTTF